MRCSQSLTALTPLPSQVFYHLGELDSALTYALGAGALFNLNEESEYVRTLVGECAAEAAVQLCSGGWRQLGRSRQRLVFCYPAPALLQQQTQ